MDQTAREQEAFNAATAMVTCLLHGDRAEARRIAYSNDILYADMLLILAEALAGCHTADSWQASVLAAHRED
ncbi:hypothetical protein ACFYVK_35655 [Streptomyces chartreusis]|uniref:hypothetical protein n=1 Tax=Streptomyces chartreusis TaxID=1969 RepID=UPI0036CDF0CB